MKKKQKIQKKVSSIDLNKGVKLLYNRDEVVSLLTKLHSELFEEYIGSPLPSELEWSNNWIKTHLK